MNGKRNNTKRGLVIAVLLLLVLAISGIFVTSGNEVRAESGINPNEQRIISVIYSTFRYQGRYYKAKSEYITKVINYLNRDDIDLTADEVTNYINKIYRNVQRGVDEGYLYEVEPATPTEDTEEPTETPTEEPTDTEAPSTQEVTEQPSTGSQGGDTATTEEKNGSGDNGTGNNGNNGSGNNGNGNNGSGNNGNGNKDSGNNGTGNNGNNGNGNNGQGGDNGTGNNGNEQQATDENGLPIDETGAVILPETKKSDIDPGDNDEDELLQYEQTKKDTLDNRPGEDDADTAIIFNEKDGTIYVRVDDADGGTYQEIRHFLPDGTQTVFLILLILCGVLTLNVILIGGAKKCFIFRQKLHRVKRRGHTKRRKLRKLLRHIMTGVATIEMLSLIVGCVFQFSLFRDDAIMTNLGSSGFFRYEYARYIERQGTGEQESYEEFLFHAKAEIRETLESGKVKAKGVLTDSAASTLYKLRSEVKDINGWMLPCMAFGLILSFAILWFLDGIRHRGVRKWSLTFGITFVIALIGWILLFVTKPFSNMYVEPDYLYRFVYELGIYMTKLVLIAAVGCGVLAGTLFGVARTMKKKLES